MAIAIHVYTRGTRGKVASRHTFYGATEAEAEELLDSHAEECTELGDLLDDEEDIQIVEEVAEIPDVAPLEELDEDEAEEG